MGQKGKGLNVMQNMENRICIAETKVITSHPVENETWSEVEVHVIVFQLQLFSCVGAIPRIPN